MKQNLFFYFLALPLFVLACHKDAPDPLRPEASFTYETIRSTPAEKVIEYTNTSKHYKEAEWLTLFGERIRDFDGGATKVRYRYRKNGSEYMWLFVSDGVHSDTTINEIPIEGLANEGQATFYTTVADKGAITVYIKESKQYIGTIRRAYLTEQPVCTGEETAWVFEQEGEYYYQAQSEGPSPLTWKGYFKIRNGECTFIKLSR
ncbi:hypothetical protein GCM10027592_57330 [Spirosoma flavus]